MRPKNGVTSMQSSVKHELVVVEQALAGDKAEAAKRVAFSGDVGVVIVERLAATSDYGTKW